MRAVLAVVGPTATGKSAVALELAARVGAHIVNADAMALYAGMDVGTAKPSPAQRAAVPHHLLDLWPVTATASVADYQQAGRACLDELAAAGVPALVVGGSGLYVRALLDDLRFPGTDAALRAQLEAELAATGAAALHARLAAVDPAAAAAILPSNGRRLVRALEVVALTGRPFTARLPAPRPAYPAVYVGLDLPTEELDRRIDARVRRMFDAGLVAEVRELAGRGLREGRTAARALGYREALAVLDGELSEDEAVRRTAQATRRFARRQRSWFRRDPRVGWVGAGRADLVAQVLRRWPVAAD